MAAGVCIVAPLRRAAANGANSDVVITGYGGVSELCVRSCANYTGWCAANPLDERIGDDPIPKSHGRWPPAWRIL